MVKIAHILFPYDFSPQGNRVVPFVRSMATRLNARVTLYSVAPPAWDLPPDGMRPLSGDEPEEWKQALQAKLDGTLVAELAGVHVERVADAGDPALRIKAFVDAHGVDLVMMPTRGHGVFRELLVGSVASKVLHDVACPVWTDAHVESERSTDAPRSVLCAVDGGDHSVALCQWASAFSVSIGASLRLVHVAPVVSDWSALESERRLQEEVRQSAETQVRALVQQAGITAALDVIAGDVGATVSEFARRQKADLVIAGRGAIVGAFGRLRAHTLPIVQRSMCPVISV